MASCTVELKSLALKIWVEDIKFSTYIHNHVPNKSLKGITPFEAWCGKKPKVSHFIIFGCRAKAHIPFHKRRVLEP